MAKLGPIELMLKRLEETERKVAMLEDEHALLLADLPPRPVIPRTSFTATRKQRDNQERLGEEVARTAADIQFLKESVPEKLAEDDNLEFFLTVADLRKTNSTLKGYLEFSEKSLGLLRQEEETMRRIVEHWSGVKSELAKGRELREVEKKQVGGGGGRDGERPAKKESDDLSNKIRATIKAYKKMKSFMAEFLKKISPGEDDDSSFAKLVQSVWTSFQADRSEYLDLDELDFQAEDATVIRLERFNIIEFDGDDPKRIRLVDFTE